MSTYVVGDIHGCYDEWMSLKNEIESKDPEARFILTGDIVDRAPKMKEMLDWAMEHISPDGKYQMVLGNHEYLKLQWATHYSTYPPTTDTPSFHKFPPEHYYFELFCKTHFKTDAELIKVIDWMKSLPLYIESPIEYGDNTINFIVCHGDIRERYLDESGKVNPELIRICKADEAIVWDRNYYGHDWEYPTIIVHGHSPTGLDELVELGAAPCLIDFRDHDINLDCGCCFNHPLANLSAIRLEDLEEFYARPVKTELYQELQEDGLIFTRDEEKEKIKQLLNIPTQCLK